MAISLAIETLHHRATSWLLFLTAAEEYLLKRGIRRMREFWVKAIFPLPPHLLNVY
jgi:hypothetical protein